MASRTSARACRVATVAVGLVLLGMAVPRPARACGGTFCDAGPAAMPVEQTGETILFVIDDGFIEAHIQIQYDPTTKAEQFAWVVPVTALPEFSVGSQQLFGNILGATVPSYGLGTWFEPCGGDSGAGDEGCDGGSGDGGSAKFDIGGGNEPPPEPEVVLATTVGAFEVFVLDGGTVEGVMQWLGDNGFAQDPAAAPILDEYLAEGLLFVAFRLATDAEASEIHPIVLRMPTTEACVPIRLTRIAAQEDMEIRALFLADDRVSSSNYRHVTLNPLKLDWIGLGANYREVVTMAVDEPGAAGHAFVSEYAGASGIVPRDDLVGPLWDPTAFAMAVDPAEAVTLLLAQELYGYDFTTGECAPSHPLVAGLVARYLTTPPDFPLQYLCDDPAAFAAVVDPVAWDGPAFAADFEDRVLAPGLHANALLDAWPYLTRLYTTLSPGEMTEDPLFHLTPELPEQTVLTQIATRNTFCDGAASLNLPDARLIALPDPFTWPDIAPESMPWVETIEYLPAAGAPVIEVDNRDAIALLLAAWNAEHGPPRAPTSAACGDEETGGLTGNETSGGSGQDDVGGMTCACQSTGALPGGLALVGLGLMGLGRRRGR
jgi:Uncharacterized protein conserved in bacteria (DUF2330)